MVKQRNSKIKNENILFFYIYQYRSDDVPDCYNRVRYIRDSCKVLSDLWKIDKDFVS